MICVEVARVETVDPSSSIGVCDEFTAAAAPDPKIEDCALLEAWIE